jgi:hypothetical protein
MGGKKLIKIKSADNNGTLKKLLNDLDRAEKQQLPPSEEQEEKETDEQREARFTELRKARQHDRDQHPENYPPTQYWWSPGSDHNTMRCYYFPRDWRQTQEELDFYRKVASDYQKGIIYRFQSYDMFLAYNHYIMDELERWRDFFELGHVHAPDENLAQWKSHDLDEHHLHEEDWYPLPYPPISWEKIGDLIKMQAAHMGDLTNEGKRKTRRRKRSVPPLL